MIEWNEDRSSIRDRWVSWSGVAGLIAKSRENRDSPSDAISTIPPKIMAPSLEGTPIMPETVGLSQALSTVRVGKPEAQCSVTIDRCARRFAAFFMHSVRTEINEVAAHSPSDFYQQPIW